MLALRVSTATTGLIVIGLGSLAAMPDADGIIFDPASAHVLAVSGRGKALMSFKPDIDPKNGKIDAPIALRGEP